MFFPLFHYVLSRDLDSRGLLVKEMESFNALRRISIELRSIAACSAPLATERLQELQVAHQSLIVEVYSESFVKPKHHQRFHAAEQLKQTGFYVDCFAMERKHSSSSRISVCTVTTQKCNRTRVNSVIVFSERYGSITSLHWRPTSLAPHCKEHNLHRRPLGKVLGKATVWWQRRSFTKDILIQRMMCYWGRTPARLTQQCKMARSFISLFSRLKSKSGQSFGALGVLLGGSACCTFPWPGEVLHGGCSWTQRSCFAFTETMCFNEV